MNKKINLDKIIKIILVIYHFLENIRNYQIFCSKMNNTLQVYLHVKRMVHPTV